MSTQNPLTVHRRRYDRLDEFLDHLARDVYPEPPSEGHDEISRRAWERLRTIVPLASGARVLDVGCGQGVGLIQFREAGLSAVGVTLSEADLSACNREGHDARRMDQSFLEFSPGEFSLVWCRHCLEHSVAPYFTLAEFRRVLAPGGLLYVEVPAPDTTCRHEWNPNHYSVLGRNAWLALLARADFTILDAFDITHDTGSGPDVYFGFICRSAGVTLAPGPRSTRLQSVSLGFEAHGESMHLELELDRSDRREHAMIEVLEAGGLPEPEVAYFLTNVLQPGDTMVDVGAQSGYFTAIASRVVGPAGAVYAFEPAEEQYRRLERHLELNALRQVRIFQAAVDGVARSAEVPCRDGPVGTDVVTLDGALTGIETGRGPRLIRIQAAGWEYEVLKGALRTIMLHEVPFVICEIDRAVLERRGTSEMHLRSFMRLIGYQVTLLKQDATGLEPLADDQLISQPGVFNLLFLRT